VDNYPDSLYVQSMLALCLHNDEFRENFLKFCESLCSEQSEKALETIMDSLSGQIRGEIKYHTERWKGTISRSYSLNVWKKNVKDMKKWAQERPAAFSSMLGQINTYFR
jgi:hypothetical protein